MGRPRVQNRLSKISKYDLPFTPLVREWPLPMIELVSLTWQEIRKIQKIAEMPEIPPTNPYFFLARENEIQSHMMNSFSFSAWLDSNLVVEVKIFRMTPQEEVQKHAV